ncbi:FecCD family ABC transporter permease [Ornithinimicrobium tianjinense]|uniref:Enterobactin ABC transporter permease n=1 Tax=Ornithinimicrobium tianjinense TaxID=1195761 RepID=A0A917BY41_9MICO|nr:iron chelate uptake ABC transporter family permease subunit [Ornithinimicrobium tianjinense]GGF60786.1 enterobactin ABC transporter permease [Ornithinimicrobium tianjinense]
MTLTTSAGAPAALAVGAVRSARRAAASRPRRVLLGLVLALVGAVLVRTLLGDYTITAADAVRILVGADGVPRGAEFVLMESKLPRALVGVLAGLALGAGGATFQLMARNPLASPDVLGLTMGASAAAVLTLVVLGGSGTAVAVAALLGAAAVALALILLSGGRTGSTAAAPTRMILVGVALSAMLTSVVHWVLLRADVYRAHEAMVWLTGSLAGATWPQIGLLALVVAVALPLLLATSAQLHLVELGDDLAHGVGAPPRPVRARALALVVVLVAATTAVCGPVAFVAFLAGPTARRLLGGRSSIAASALVGAVVVVLADHLAAYAIPEVNLPVGVVTGLVGAPFLLWLLTRERSTS